MHQCHWEENANRLISQGDLTLTSYGHKNSPEFRDDDGQTQTYIERPVLPSLPMRFPPAWHAYISCTFLGYSVTGSTRSVQPQVFRTTLVPINVCASISRDWPLLAIHIVSITVTCSTSRTTTGVRADAFEVYHLCGHLHLNQDVRKKYFVFLSVQDGTTN